MTRNLEYALVAATLRFRVAAAESRFVLRTTQLKYLLEHRYRPDQPRAPRGTPEGGQWVDDPAVSRPTDATPRRAVLVAATTKNFKYACRALKIDPRKASDALHDAKRKNGLDNDDNCVFDTTTGNITFNGEIIGNLMD